MIILIRQSTSNKIKNEHLGLHQTKNLFHSKRNHPQNENTTYKMGKIFKCKPYICYGAYIQKKNSYNLIAKKKLKIGKGPEYTFSQRSPKGT